MFYFYSPVTLTSLEAVCPHLARFGLDAYRC